MPPTIQSGNPDRNRKRPGDKRSDLVCRVKYCNTLPDIPFDPKFVTYPFDSNRFVHYNATSLERNYKHELLTENDLGIVIDLITPDAYSVNPNVSLDPADEKLLEDEIIAPQNSKRSKYHATSVSWMRRTEYISTEYNRFQPSFEKAETKVGYNVKKNLKEETLYMDRESQIGAIDKTFEDAKIPIEKHYSKPGVTMESSCPIYPDFDVWKYPCAQVIFDSDPAPSGRPLSAQIEEMSQAMIRGVMDESGEQFVAYFLPTEETVRKRKRDKEAGTDYEFDEEYDYKMSREYNWNVKNKATKGYEENYFFVLRDDQCFYNELETRVRLSKRRAKGGKAQANNSRLVVKHRPLNEIEMKAHEHRLRQLEPPQEEEEVEVGGDGDGDGEGEGEGEGEGDRDGEEEEEDNEENTEDTNQNKESDASDKEDNDKGSDKEDVSGSGSDDDRKSAVEQSGDEENSSDAEQSSGSEDKSKIKNNNKSSSESFVIRE
ncbi:RNA polymerase II-associated factor 1 [Nymphon striatum]|nr:RNA polymerase II-associated factor 1 [Nymphon striatum]